MNSPPISATFSELPLINIDQLVTPDIITNHSGLKDYKHPNVYFLQ